MICCCIENQLSRDRLAGTNAHGQSTDDGGGSGSDDSEFLSADEEVSDQAPDSESVPTVAGTGARPLGVAITSDTLRLLGSSEPLRIPVTQEEGPMTEDMVAEREEMLTGMGTSAAASQRRGEMQSMSLRSDMMAFKAANPGCVLADFVRWHSPRDWVATVSPGANGSDEAAVASVTDPNV